MNRNLFLFLLLFVFLLIECVLGASYRNDPKVKVEKVKTPTRPVAGIERPDLMMARYELQNLDWYSRSESN